MRQGTGRGRWRRLEDFSLDRFDPATQTDIARLATNRPARVASDLYQRVLSLQGPDGTLVANEQQKHAITSGRWALATVLAVWSPEGGISRPGVANATPALLARWARSNVPG